MITLREAKSDREYKIAIGLFLEYASQLGFDLSFQNFDEEIEHIEEHYSRQNGGVLFIGYSEKNEASACFGIRKLGKNICELKRMYVIKKVRGLGIGKQLLTKAIGVATSLGYEK